MIAISFQSAEQAEITASRVCIVVDVIMILLFAGLGAAAVIVRPKGDSTAIRTRKFLYAAVGSMVLAGLDRLVDLVHCALMLQNSLTAQDFYIPFVFEELFCMASCTVLTFCTLWVLDNRAAAVWPAAAWRRPLRLGNWAIVAVTGLLSLLDVAFAAKWVASTLTAVAHQEANDGHVGKAMRQMVRKAEFDWGAVLVAAHSWHILMSLYVMAMAGYLYKNAKPKNIGTQNIISLGLIGVYMLVRATNKLANHGLPLIERGVVAPATNSMLVQMLVDGIPLLLAYASLVVIGKRHNELGGEQERNDPFADPPPRRFLNQYAQEAKSPEGSIRNV